MMKRTEAPDLHLFYVIHRSMRTDSRRFAQVLDTVDPDDLAGLDQLARWFDGFKRAIVAHHRVEDAAYWPALRARDPEFAAEQKSLVDDHHDLDQALVAITHALETMRESAGRPRWSLAKHEAVAAVDRLVDLLDEHVQEEEATALPRLAAVFTVEEYAGIQAKAHKMGKLRDLSFAVPWLISHMTPCELVEETDARRVLRLLYRLSWRRRYEELARPLRGSDPLPSRSEVMRLQRAC